MNFKKLRYKILSTITWGNKRSHYAKKYQDIKGVVIVPSLADFKKHTHELKSVLMAQKLHEKTFSKYKNMYQGKTVVLVATGPTLANFEPLDDVVYVGVNRAFQDSRIKLDYLFMQDYLGLHYIEDVSHLTDMKKFYGLMRPGLLDGWMIPESIAIRHGAERYYVQSAWDPECVNPDYAYDITGEPLKCYGSVVFSAMQFILYTNPAKVILVGCDTSNSGYYDKGEANALQCDYVLRGWKRMHDFVKMYYPETEVVSMNPVGLKGLFTDVYTNGQDER